MHRIGKTFERASRFGRFALCLLLSSSTIYHLPSAFSAPVTGAAVDESRVARTYYVDAAGADAADDEKHGMQDSPFSTLGHACRVAARDKDANIGVKIIVAAGTYREAIEIGPPVGKDAADTDAPLVIEAAERDQAIIDAADAAGWTADTWKPEGAEWVHPWPFQRARAAGALHAAGRGPGVAVPPPVGALPTSARENYHRADLVFLNGVALREIDAAAALAPGTFRVGMAGKDHRAAIAPTASVRVQPPEGAEIADAVFQVGARDHGLLIEGRRNVVVRGFLFQHAANPANPASVPAAGLVLRGCANVLVEDVLSQWNDGAGLVVTGRATAPWSAGITLRRVRLIHNGGSGLLAANLKNVLAEDCETSFNNFRGEWAASIDPQGPAGLKAAGVHGSTWRRHRAVGNRSRGLWWAGDCTDLTVEDGVAGDNLFSGLFIDNCPGPTVVRGCLVAGNKLPPGSQWDRSFPAAVSMAASPDVTLENNVVAGNAMPQLGLWDVAERNDGVNFETGAKTTLRAERHAYRHNVLWGADAEQIACDLPLADRAGKDDFAFYYGTLDSDENCFWNPALAEVFCTYDRTSYHRPGLGLLGWRTFLLAHSNAGGGEGRRPEAGSLWQDPLFMEPAEGDYRLQAQSPLIDWGLPADEGTVAQ